MPPRFALIELDRVPRFAWIAEKHGRRMRFVLENGTSALEPARAVLYQWDGAGEEREAAALAELRAHGAATDRAAPLDAAALHARIGEGQGWPFERISAELLGEGASGWDRAALYLALLREERHFRPARGEFVARSAIEMRQIAERLDTQRRQHAWLTRVAEWRTALESPAPGPDWNGDDPEAREFLAQLDSLLAFETKSPHWKALARPLDLLAHDWVANRARLKRLLERAGAWRGWERLWRLGGGVPERFEADALALAASLAARPAEPRGRTDYRDQPTYSFDSPGTRDYDDAVTILATNGETLDIAAHVADVSCALAPGDPLWEEALRRGASLYTEDEIVPMLPEPVSNGRFSLVAGRDRETVSFRVRLAPEGVAFLGVERGLIRVTGNLDYESGEALLKREQSWARLSERCRELGAVRGARGAFVAQRPEIVLDISDPARITLRRVDRHDPIHRLVEELAILVNGEAGLYCQRNGLLALHRVQPPPPAGMNYPPAAYFSLEGAPHAGVACARYVQVTSPIRRFADLVMQRQIATHAETGQPAFRERAVLERWMRHAEQRLATYHQLERRVDDLWKRRYLAQNIGLEMLGQVRRNGGALHARVFLDDVMLEAQAHLAPSVGEGHRGRFKVVASDPDRETVEVVMVRAV